MSSRNKILAQLAERICALECDHPLRVAIDGVDAAGKTILADELASLIEALGRPVIRASVDGFHNPRDVRYRLGADSPEGYYRDSFNHAAILQSLLIPLESGGDRQYRRAVFDYRVDAPIREPVRSAPEDAILLFDGVFLLRSELADCWDFSIFVDVDFDVSVPRAVERAVARSAGELTPQSVFTQYNQRYVPGQQIYLAEANPKEKADILLNNDDWENPHLI